MYPAYVVDGNFLNIQFIVNSPHDMSFVHAEVLWKQAQLCKPISINAQLL